MTTENHDMVDKGGYGSPVTPRQGPLVSANALMYLGYLGLIVVASAAALVFDPLYVIGALLGSLGLFLIFRYPFFGFVLYLFLYFLRPGERFTALAPLRVELTFGVVLLLAIVIHDALKGTRIRFPRDRISTSILVFIGAFWLGVIFSVWKEQSAEAMIAFLKTFVFYYFVVVMADNEKRFNITFWVIVLLTCFAGAEAAYIYFTGGYSLNQGIMRSGGATSFGEHSNSLAMYMTTTIPMLIYLIVKYRKPVARFLCFAMMAVCFVTLIITGSRSGVLSLLGTAFTYAWFSRHRFAYFVLIVFLSVATFFAMPEQYKERYGSIASDQVDASSQGRLDAWAAGMRMFVDYPVTGVGPQAFAAAYLQREGMWLYSHSLYVELLASMGVVGTAAWGWFLYQLFAALGRMIKRRKDDEAYQRDTVVFVRATYAIIFGLLVAGVFGHILFRDTWYVLAGLVVAKEKLTLKEPETA